MMGCLGRFAFISRCIRGYPTKTARRCSAYRPIRTIVTVIGLSKPQPKLIRAMNG